MVITQRVVTVAYRRFGATCRPHPQGTRIQTLRMYSIGRPETSVRNWRYLLRNNPEERSYQPPGGGSLKSHILKKSVFNNSVVLAFRRRRFAACVALRVCSLCSATRFLPEGTCCCIYALRFSKAWRKASVLFSFVYLVVMDWLSGVCDVDTVLSGSYVHTFQRHPAASVIMEAAGFSETSLAVTRGHT